MFHYFSSLLFFLFLNSTSNKRAFGLACRQLPSFSKTQPPCPHFPSKIAVLPQSCTSCWAWGRRSWIASRSGRKRKRRKCRKCPRKLACAPVFHSNYASGWIGGESQVSFVDPCSSYGDHLATLRSCRQLGISMESWALRRIASFCTSCPALFRTDLFQSWMSWLTVTRPDFVCSIVQSPTRLELKVLP